MLHAGPLLVNRYGILEHSGTSALTYGPLSRNYYLGDMSWRVSAPYRFCAFPRNGSRAFWSKFRSLIFGNCLTAWVESWQAYPAAIGAAA